MNNQSRFLFFVQREFHLEIFQNIANYIESNNLGKIGVLTPPYSPSKNGNRNLGARHQKIFDWLGSFVEIVRDPYDFSPDITFLADSGYEYVEGLGLLVNVGHGTICKGSFFTNSALSFRDNGADIMCVPGFVHKRNIENWLDIPTLVTGMPKLDMLFNPKNTREQVLAKLKLDPSKKTILLAPTYNKEYSVLYHLNTNFSDIFPTDYNLIVKLHGITDEALKNNLEFNLLNREDTCILDDLPLAEAMIVADVLVSDVSSVIYEFVPVKKPVLLFDSPDMFKHPKFNPRDLEHQYRGVGKRFRKVSEIPRLLKECERNNFRAHPAPNIVNMFLSVKDGSSSELVVSNSLSMRRNFSKRGTIITVGKVPDSIKKRYDFRYKIIEQDSLDFKQHKGLIDQFEGDVIMVYNSTLSISPLTPDLLMSHLSKVGNIGIIVPMLSNRFDLPQKISNFVPKSEGVPDNQIVGPLSYMTAGHVKFINSIIPDIFAMRKDEYIRAIKFLYDTKDVIDWKDILKMVEKFRKKPAVAMDCFAY